MILIFNELLQSANKCNQLLQLVKAKDLENSILLEFLRYPNPFSRNKQNKFEAYFTITKSWY